jgi:hypothetical protein
LKEARKAFKAAAEAEIRKTLRSLKGQLQGILEADFFPDKAVQAAQAASAGLRALH